MKTPLTLALFGAGGKMGCRVHEHLRQRSDYTLLCVESGERGLANLQARGLVPVPPAEALARADVVILALPDRILGAVARGVVPLVRTGAIVMMLDPSAAIRAFSNTSAPWPRSTISSVAPTPARRSSVR
jgi:3-hydroxyisobutyrate dehydrogenase-like beta-hydroxyacid dehydrogenase